MERLSETGPLGPDQIASNQPVEVIYTKDGRTVHARYLNRDEVRESLQPFIIEPQEDAEPTPES